MAIADFNNDGHADILTGNINQRNRIYFGDGNLNFEASIDLDTIADRTYSVDVGDFNKDGYLDIVIGNSGELNTAYTNHISEFKVLPLSNNKFKTYDIKLVDLNKDGYLDVVEANSEAPNMYYFNSIPRK